MLLWTSVLALYIFSHSVSLKMCPNQIIAQGPVKKVIQQSREQTMDLVPAFL